MINIKKIIFGSFLMMPCVSRAALSPDCVQYKTCDEIAACEMYVELEHLLAGDFYNFESAFVRTIVWGNGCSNYADQFESDINYQISQDPVINVLVNWASVKQKAAIEKKYADGWGDEKALPDVGLGRPDGSLTSFLADTETDVIVSTAGGLGGAAAGALAGAAFTSWTGPGAIIGALIGGGIGAVSSSIAVLRSASDILIDPLTGVRTGCNAPLETSTVIGNDRNVVVGGYMFCGQYKQNADGERELVAYVPGFARQCLQNEAKPSTTEDRIWGMFKDDFWNPECKLRLCDNADQNIPLDGNGNPSPDLEWRADIDNVCWYWRRPIGSEQE